MDKLNDTINDLHPVTSGVLLQNIKIVDLRFRNCGIILKRGTYKFTTQIGTKVQKDKIYFRDVVNNEIRCECWITPEEMFVLLFNQVL